MAMEENKKTALRKVARVSALGLEMGLSIAIGIATGYFLDSYFKTRPWLTFIFLFLGIAAAFRSLFSLMKGINQNSRKE